MTFQMRNIRIGIRIQLITAAAVAGMVAIMALSLFDASRQMRQDRATKTQHVLETAFATLTYFAAEETAGRLSRELHPFMLTVGKSHFASVICSACS